MDDLKNIILPHHIAIIMDGNGRWAREHKMSRIQGHRKGAERVREITHECARLGIKRLTLYAFSQENWKRPKLEINFLMRLLKRYLVKERKEIMDNNIRFTAIGRIKELPDAVKKELAKITEISKNNKGMVLCLALNYGGRQEIIDAVKSIAEDALAGKCDIANLNEGHFSQYLYDPEMEDVDLLIRTSGEVRISNFLLWQISYAELWITPVLWPDFKKEYLHRAIIDFSKRERRFGGINPHHQYIGVGIKPQNE